MNEECADMARLKALYREQKRIHNQAEYLNVCDQNMRVERANLKKQEFDNDDKIHEFLLGVRESA